MLLLKWRALKRLLLCTDECFNGHFKVGEKNLPPPRYLMMLAEKCTAMLQRENIFSSYMFPTNKIVKHSLNDPFWGGKKQHNKHVLLCQPLCSITSVCVPLISAFPFQCLMLLNCSHTNQMTGKPLVGGGWDGL